MVIENDSSSEMPESFSACQSSIPTPTPHSGCPAFPMPQSGDMQQQSPNSGTGEETHFKLSTSQELESGGASSTTTLSTLSQFVISPENIECVQESLSASATFDVVSNAHAIKEINFTAHDTNAIIEVSSRLANVNHLGASAEVNMSGKGFKLSVEAEDFVPRHFRPLSQSISLLQSQTLNAMFVPETPGPESGASPSLQNEVFLTQFSYESSTSASAPVPAPATRNSASLEGTSSESEAQVQVQSQEQAGEGTLEHKSEAPPLTLPLSVPVFIQNTPDGQVQIQSIASMPLIISSVPNGDNLANGINGVATIDGTQVQIVPINALQNLSQVQTVGAPIQVFSAAPTIPLQNSDIQLMSNPLIAAGQQLALTMPIQSVAPGVSMPMSPQGTTQFPFAVANSAPCPIIPGDSSISLAAAAASQSAVAQMAQMPDLVAIQTYLTTFNYYLPLFLQFFTGRGLNDNSPLSSLASMPSFDPSLFLGTLRNLVTSGNITEEQMQQILEHISLYGLTPPSALTDPVKLGQVSGSSSISTSASNPTAPMQFLSLPIPVSPQTQLPVPFSLLPAPSQPNLPQGPLAAANAMNLHTKAHGENLSASMRAHISEEAPTGPQPLLGLNPSFSYPGTHDIAACQESVSSRMATGYGDDDETVASSSKHPISKMSRASGAHHFGYGKHQNQRKHERDSLPAAMHSGPMPLLQAFSSSRNPFSEEGQVTYGGSRSQNNYSHQQHPQSQIPSLLPLPDHFDPHGPMQPNSHSAHTGTGSVNNKVPSLLSPSIPPLLPMNNANNAYKNQHLDWQPPQVHPGPANSNRHQCHQAMSASSANSSQHQSGTCGNQVQSQLEEGQVTEANAGVTSTVQTMKSNTLKPNAERGQNGSKGGRRKKGRGGRGEKHFNFEKEFPALPIKNGDTSKASLTPTSASPSILGATDGQIDLGTQISASATMESKADLHVPKNPIISDVVPIEAKSRYSNVSKSTTANANTTHAAAASAAVNTTSSSNAANKQNVHVVQQDNVVQAIKSSSKLEEQDKRACFHPQKQREPHFNTNGAGAPNLKDGLENNQQPSANGALKGHPSIHNRGPLNGTAYNSKVTKVADAESPALVQTRGSRQDRSSASGYQSYAEPRKLPEKTEPHTRNSSEDAKPLYSYALAAAQAPPSPSPLLQMQTQLPANFAAQTHAQGQGQGQGKARTQRNNFSSFGPNAHERESSNASREAATLRYYPFNRRNSPSQLATYAGNNYSTNATASFESVAPNQASAITPFQANGQTGNQYQAQKQENQGRSKKGRKRRNRARATDSALFESDEPAQTNGVGVHVHVARDSFSRPQQTQVSPIAMDSSPAMSKQRGVINLRNIAPVAPPVQGPQGKNQKPKINKPFQLDLSTLLSNSMLSSASPDSKKPTQEKRESGKHAKVAGVASRKNPVALLVRPTRVCIARPGTKVSSSLTLSSLPRHSTKIRLTPRVRRPTTLKSIIRAARARRLANLSSKLGESQEGNASEEQVLEHEKPQIQKTSPALALAPAPAPAQPLDPFVERALATVHSRRYREYCAQVLTPEINRLAGQLVQDLNQFQKRSLLADPMKARMRRRLAFGLHECRKLARAGRLRILLLAADLERVPGARGLDHLVAAILNSCEEHHTTVVFFSSRYMLARVLNKRIPQSCVGILNYGGCEITTKELLLRAESAKASYIQLIEHVSQRFRKSSENASLVGPAPSTSSGIKVSATSGTIVPRFDPERAIARPDQVDDAISEYIGKLLAMVKSGTELTESVLHAIAEADEDWEQGNQVESAGAALVEQKPLSAQDVHVHETTQGAKKNKRKKKPTAAAQAAGPQASEQVGKGTADVSSFLAHATQQKHKTSLLGTLLSSKEQEKEESSPQANDDPDLIIQALIGTGEIEGKSGATGGASTVPMGFGAVPL